MDQLAALAELVASAVAEVLGDGARLRLPRAAGEVSVLHEVGEAASTVSSSRSKPCSSSAAAIWLADWSDSMPDNPEVNRRMMAMYWAASSFTA